MICKYKYLDMEKIKLSVVNSTCWSCGAPIISFSVDAIYRGHAIFAGELCDWFDLMQTILCPSCGTRIISWADFCGSDQAQIIATSEMICAESR